MHSNPTQPAIEPNQRIVALDVHCKFTELAAVSPAGKRIASQRCNTTIPDVLAALQKVKKPRTVIIEEGSLADWLMRGLTECGECVRICDPRRNALVAKDDEKDDPIDALKLAQLARGGFLKFVHHPESFERVIFKRRIALYHDRIRNRVRQANRVIAQARLYGVMIRESDFAEDTAAVFKQLPKRKAVRDDFQTLLDGYQAAVTQAMVLRRGVLKLSKAYPEIARFQSLPGYGPIRAATFFAFLDTPWRFRSKAAVWKYVGIGLCRRGSGGSVTLHVPNQVNRVLKSAVLGAAMNAVGGDGEFSRLHERWVKNGLTARMARRNVARLQTAVLWGMWKSGGEYRCDRIARLLEPVTVS
ncbi:MAG: transposase [Phycisphaerales bacterium]|nr:transposase [Phycisphaerales bacterium]